MEKKPTGRKTSIQVNVKFASGSGHPSNRESLSSMPGVINAIQTFPNESDQELAGLFLLEVEESKIDSALQKLRTLPKVEFAEVAAPRKLIRGEASHDT